MKQQADVAYRQIRDRLMAGSILPGTRLVESTWADQLNVNRGDIRQALSRLLAEGTVIRGEKGGFFARDYNPQEVEEIIEVRLILETAAARLAAARATAEELRQLDEICDHMQLMAENAYEMGFTEADVRFHQLLVQAAHNRELAHTYMHANIPIAATSSHNSQDLREKLLDNARDHRSIVHSLREHEPEKAVQLLINGFHKKSLVVL